MSSNDIYIGDIRKCTAYIGESLVCAYGNGFSGFELESELYKKDAILYRTKNGRYVDIDMINSIFDSFIIKRHESIDKLGLLMPTIAYGEDTLYIDKKTLKPYYRDEQVDISVRKLKRELHK